jgi:hypothetical protein
MTSPFTVEAFDHYWAMWNDTELARVRDRVDNAVTDDFIFCDPLHFHTGRQALEDNVRAFRADWPTATFEIVSGVDNHHNRHRYRWNFLNNGDVVLEGLDIATVDADGLIERIDGFFGDLQAPDLLTGSEPRGFSPRSG